VGGSLYPCATSDVVVSLEAAVVSGVESTVVESVVSALAVVEEFPTSVVTVGV
jgi:hypothetical protein